MFRDIYQLERRAIERTGDSIFLCLLTLYEEEGSEAKSYFLKRAMEHLDDAIAASLRRGDVYTRYSVSQYLILLPSPFCRTGIRGAWGKGRGQSHGYTCLAAY